MTDPGYATVFHPAEHPLRGIWARIGIVALNLIQPGMGLVRLGNLRAGLVLAALPLALYLGLVWLLSKVSSLTFQTAIIGIAALFGLVLCIYVYAFAASWRQSRQLLPRSGHAWRWYGLAAIAVLATVASWPITDRMHDHYKPYYVPSIAMAPTFMVNDRILAKMGNLGPLSRGDSVIVATRGTVYVKRVAGLPGDKIGLRNAIVTIGGSPVPQTAKGNFEFTGSIDPEGKTAMLFEERFPGEQRGHSIIDSGPFMQDDFPDVVLGPKQYFLLGDNRDNSADSRFPPQEMGLGIVEESAIKGKVLFRYWRDGEGLKEGRP